MSMAEEACTFVYEPPNGTAKSLLEAAGITENDVWHCPHHTKKGDDLCCFHKPVDQKDDAEVTEEIANRIQAVSVGDDEVLADNTLQFVGAKLGSLALSDYLDEIDIADRRLTFFGSTIGRTNWTGLSITAGNVDFQNILIDGLARFSNTTFDCETEFRGSKFNGPTNFKSATFNETVEFIGVRIAGYANFSNVEFSGTRSDFHKAVFEQKANFSKMEGSPNFSEVEFGAGANFSKATLTGIFDSAVFNGRAYFKTATIPHASFEYVTFTDETNFYGVDFDAAVQFDHATFEDGVNFKDADHDHLSFPYADITGARFDNATIPFANFNHANLSDAIFEGTDLRGSNLASANLTRAMLFDANLPGAFLSGTIFRDAQINEHTRLLGHHTDTIEAKQPTPTDTTAKQCCVYDPEYQSDNEHKDVAEARRVYKKIETLANTHVRSQLENRCKSRREELTKLLSNRK